MTLDSPNPASTDPDNSGPGHPDADGSGPCGTGPTGPDPADAAILVQLAQFAETDLTLGPTLLPGFSPFFTVPFPAKPITDVFNTGQAYFASGALPSAPNSIITLLAFGLPWPVYLNQGGLAYTQLSQQLVSYGGSSTATALAAPVTAYQGLRAAVWNYFSKTVPDRDLWIVGGHLGGVMAQVAATDFQPGAKGPNDEKGPARKPTVLAFSAPPSGNKDFAALVTASCTDAWTLDTQQTENAKDIVLDTFPGAPIPQQTAMIGTVPVGEPVMLTTTAAPTGLPVGGSDSWIERTSAPYATALGAVPLNPGTLPGAVRTSAAGFDTATALAHANLVGAVANIAQSEPADTGTDPYTLDTPLTFTPIADSGQSDATHTWGATFSDSQNSDALAIALRDVISWVDLAVIASHGAALPIRNLAPFNEASVAADFRFANVHSGVLTLFNGLWPQVQAAVDAALAASAATQVSLSGHGIGGALAYMLATALRIVKPDAPAPVVHTFGAANFGDYSFRAGAEKLLTDGTFAVTRPADFMPRTYFNVAPVFVPVGEPVQLLGRAAVDDPFSHSLSSYYTLLTQAAG